MEPHRGFLFQSGEAATTIIEAITVTGGYAYDGGYPDDDSGGGALACFGGSNPTLLNCIFDGNLAYMGGGAAWCEESSPTFTECTFLRNGIDWEGSGGAIWCTNSSPALFNCSFYDNQGYYGSVIECRDGSAPTLDNSIVAFNLSTDEDPAVVCDGTSSVQVACCDVFGNNGGDYVGCLQGLLGLNGNISQDPLFCDPIEGDLRLRDDSPCAEENNPQCGQIGAWPAGCQIPVLIMPDGSGDYPTIQAAIDAATDGGIIELADGTFTGDGNRDLDLQGKVLTIRSLNRDPTSCIIDCQASATDQHRGFNFDDSAENGCLVQGITIMNANQILGGAFQFFQTAPMIADCVIHHCEATGGAGAYCYQSSPMFESCTFVENSAVSGIFFCSDNASPVFENTIIANSPTGASFLALSGSNPELSCSDIWGNAGGDWVGAIAGQLGINGNINEDPIFCDPAAADYTIHYDSPCAPHNSGPGCDLIGALPVRCGDQGVISELLIPTHLQLAASAPSTLDGATRIAYAIPGGGKHQVRLEIFDLTGRLVRTLVDAEQPAGRYAVSWMGEDNRGARIESGIYFTRLIWNGEKRTRSLVLVK
jgi:hypothetical protein